MRDRRSVGALGGRAASSARALAAALAVVVALGPAGDAAAQSTYRDPEVSDAHVMDFGSEDAEMNAAMAHARATLDVFVELTQAHPEAFHLLKIHLRLPDGGGVYKWMMMEDWGDGAPTGRFVAATPALGIAQGDSYTASFAEIADWSVILQPVETGAIYGDFTTRVMISRDPTGPGQIYAGRHAPLPEPRGQGLYEK